MARCNCSGGPVAGCDCALVAGENVSITGTGAGPTPYVISSTVDTEAIRAALSAGDGIEYDPDTGVIGAALSVEAGNQLSIALDGGLYVPPPPAALSSFVGMIVNVTTGITAWTKAANPDAKWLRVRCIGGGGGGAGATSAASQALARGGGAGGGYSEAWVEVSTLPASVNVTVGAGGTAGVAANGAGGTGNPSSFGTFVTANGGGGAPATATSALSGVSESGAPTSSGTTQFSSLGPKGDRGLWWSATIGVGGNGGTGGGGHGPGGRGGIPGTGAQAGSAPGGGGGGAISINAAAVAGGNGGPGGVIIEMFR